MELTPQNSKEEWSSKTKINTKNIPHIKKVHYLNDNPAVSVKIKVSSVKDKV